MTKRKPVQVAANQATISIDVFDEDVMWELGRKPDISCNQVVRLVLLFFHHNNSYSSIISDFLIILQSSVQLYYNASPHESLSFKKASSMTSVLDRMFT
jgi:hypothetical protein